MSSSTAESVRDAALKLSEQDRAWLAGELWDSLPQEPVTSPVELRELLARRIAEIDAGQEIMVPWDEARRRIWDDDEE